MATHKLDGQKPRVWRKFHLGTDEKTQEIRAVQITEKHVGYAPVLPVRQAMEDLYRRRGRTKRSTARINIARSRALFDDKADITTEAMSRRRCNPSIRLGQQLMARNFT